MALSLGLPAGMLEGVAHMVLQHFGVLDNVWYQIIWIAAITNGLAVGALGLVLALGLRRSKRLSLALNFSALLVMFAASLPLLALVLKQWLRGYAIVIVTLALSVGFARWFRNRQERVLRSFRAGVPWISGLVLLTFMGIQGGFWLRERIDTARLPLAEAGAPDVLIIVIDALRSDHLSAYGYPRATSPNLDRLASEGVLFEHAFSAASYTLPSHASILTGLFPYQHGVEWGTSKRQATATYPTLPLTLQERGYRTGAFSGNTFWFTREHGFGRGFLHFEDFFHSLLDMVSRTAYGRMFYRIIAWRLGWEDIPARKHADETNRAVLHWLARDRNRPFFVIINYMDVHDPYLPPQPYRSRFSTERNPGGLLNWDLHVPDSLTPGQLQSEIAAYDGAIAYTDDQIGKLLTALRERSSTRDLLLVVTSDHGEEFAEHGGFLHGEHLYREVIQVPLILWRPGRIPRDRRISRPVSNAEIPATIMALLGDSAASFPGPPLQRLWESPSDSLDWPFPLSELRRRPWAPKRARVRFGSLRSLVSPTLHYILSDSLGAQLYDWVADPRESVDLIGGVELTGAIKDFRDRFSGLPNPRVIKQP
jgi:arylsulfatase A-like enzyme